MPIAIHPHFDTVTNTVSYVVIDQDSARAVIIDPVLDFEAKAATIATTIADRLLAIVDEQGATLDYVLETHAHADHLTAAHYIRARTGAKVVIGAHIRNVQSIFTPVFAAEPIETGEVFDMLVDEGDTLAFVGDTLFMPDYGTARADFPGGDAATLYRSIRKILALPSETRIFVGHDYLPKGRSDFRWETTVAEQRAANVHVHDGVSEAEFVAMREARDATLDAPTLILPSLQVNIQGGKLPSPDAEGRAFLRLPINALGKHSPLPAELFE
jgi:glyoxylase-like metal-dependent hydrolase (beta-lactamase superfamily II)